MCGRLGAGALTVIDGMSGNACSTHDDDDDDDDGVRDEDNSDRGESSHLCSIKGLDISSVAVMMAARICA